MSGYDPNVSEDGPNMSEYVRICPYMCRNVRICPNISENKNIYIYIYICICICILKSKLIILKSNILNLDSKMQLYGKVGDVKSLPIRSHRDRIQRVHLKRLHDFCSPPTPLRKHGSAPQQGGWVPPHLTSTFKRIEQLTTNAKCGTCADAASKRWGAQQLLGPTSEGKTQGERTTIHCTVPALANR